MDEGSARVGRRYPAHGVLSSNAEPTIVFVTVCTQERLPWLASDAAHQLIREVWQNATAWQVGRYLLMPDHVHFFCAPTASEISLEKWISFWKSRISTLAPDPAWRWQTGHWDTRLRRSDNYTAKWNYVSQNPVRAGLVKDPEDWPYQGEPNFLPWL